MALGIGFIKRETPRANFSMYKASLNTRIILFTVAVVTVTSVLFAFGVLTLKNRLEQATFGRMAEEQMAYLLSDPTAAQVDQAGMLVGWNLTSSDNAAKLPRAIAALPLGSHHSVQVADNYYQVQVSQQADKIFYLSYDITAWEEQEHQVLSSLLYGSLLITVLAALVAIFTSQASLRPLHALTKRLSNIQPDQRDIRIAGEFSGDEVHSIATEFDRYLKRLDEFVERERFISAAASHELRTPLSIIMGAIDVIEASSPEQANSKALTRIKRACDEMLAFIEATLFLSREDSKFAEQSGQVSMRQLATELIEELENQLGKRNVDITNAILDSAFVNQRSSILKMIVGNILRNAIEHTRDGSIKLTMTDNTLVITDTGEGINIADINRVFDRSFTTKATGYGMGLTLAKKLCDRLGWTLAIASTVGVGTTVSIDFSPQRSLPENTL
jgi:signal transduction histidine kinase